MASKTSTVHRLKVTLRTSGRPVWRRIEVPSDIKLSKLAGVLEAAMGWYGGHRHAFEAGKVLYQLPDDDYGTGFGPKPVDERKARLDVVMPAVKSRLRWDYDFGDGWEHDVVVEAIESPTEGVRYPMCLAGRRACPPEDCGGPWGYANLLEAVGDPSHEDHADKIEWLPADFDPEHFDVDEATDMMRSPRPLEDW